MGKINLTRMDICCILCTLYLMPTAAFAQRHVEGLNFGWEFRLNDEGDWRRVDVPHDFPTLHTVNVK